MSWLSWLVGGGGEEAQAAQLSVRRDGGGEETTGSLVFVRVYEVGEALAAPGALEPQAGGELSHSSRGGNLHTGVEVYGVEWSFPLPLDGVRKGVLACPPGQNASFKFRETLSMGCTTQPLGEVLVILDALRADFHAESHDAKTRNSHHFSQAFCSALGVARLPTWISSVGPLYMRPSASRNVERVMVRVYNLTTAVMARGFNSMLKSFGAFHSGVEVYGREWSFGQTPNVWATGIVEHQPGQNPDHHFRETLVMGYTKLPEEHILDIIDEMRYEWKGCTYDLLSRNCHNFTDAFCVKLGVGHLPAWVNNLASSFAVEPEAHQQQLPELPERPAGQTT